MLFGFTKPQDVGAALRIYEEEAGKGDTNAMNSLGTIYEEGRLVPKNLKKAISFFLKSAEQNSPEGLYKVGQFLEKGLVKTKELFSGLYHNRESEVRGAIGYL
jgi:TPR repeat protein